MCFRKAIWLGRSLSETRCNVIAVRLLTIAVLQSIVSPDLSISCRLITPYIRPFWFKNDETVVTLARTAFDASCAAMVPQFLYTHSGLVFRQLREIVRARVAQAGAATRAGCAHRSGSIGRTNVFDYRSNSGAVLCTEPPALVDTPVVNCCYVRAGRCPAVRTERSRPTGNVSLV
jgi:hypothetical protein